MNSSYKNRTLWIILAVLAALFAVVFTTRNRKRTSSYDPLLYRLDTAEVHAIDIYPPQSAEGVIRLEKDSVWTASLGKVVSRASQGKVQGILKEMTSLEASRILGKGKDLWKEFAVGDSLGAKVVFYNRKGKPLAEIHTGNLRFSQSQVPGANGRPNVKPYTPVRVEGDHSVYAVEGYLGMVFSKEFSQYRDQTLSAFNRNAADRISVKTPEDRYELLKENNVWMLGGFPADSASVADYLSGLSRLHSSRFRDEFSPAAPAPYILEVWQGEKPLAKIEGWPVDKGGIVVRPQGNPASFMEVAEDKWQNELFPSRDSLLHALSSVSN